MAEERKPMRPNPRFSSAVATAPGDAAKVVVTVRPRPNTPLILAARDGALAQVPPPAPALTHVDGHADGKEQEPLPAAPVAVVEEPVAAPEAPVVGPEVPIVPEPSSEEPQPALVASTASEPAGASEAAPPSTPSGPEASSAPDAPPEVPDPTSSAPQAQGRGEKRSIPSPGALGKWMDSVFGESDPDSQASGGGRLKYNLNFPPAMHDVIGKTDKAPGTLAREAAVWALDKDPIMLTKDLVTRCARKISEGRKRANNPSNLTYPVTLNIPGSYTSAVGIATKRCGMDPVPYFEAITVLYAGFMLSEHVPNDNNQQNADGVN